MYVSGSFDNSFGFTGEQTDSTGQVYLRARYYAPEMGIFPSLDPFEGIHSRPMSLNGYSWVEGNPIMNTDPNGNVAISPNSGCGIFDGLSSGAVNLSGSTRQFVNDDTSLPCRIFDENGNTVTFASTVIDPFSDRLFENIGGRQLEMYTRYYSRIPAIGSTVAALCQFHRGATLRGMFSTGLAILGFVHPPSATTIGFALLVADILIQTAESIDIGALIASAFPGVTSPIPNTSGRCQGARDGVYFGQQGWTPSDQLSQTFFRRAGIGEELILDSTVYGVRSNPIDFVVQHDDFEWALRRLARRSDLHSAGLALRGIENELAQGFYSSSSNRASSDFFAHGSLRYPQLASLLAWHALYNVEGTPDSTQIVDAAILQRLGELSQ